MGVTRFAELLVMSPTVSPVTFGLAAKLKVIAQSFNCWCGPRSQPEAPRKSTSPGANPLNGAALTLPVR